MLESDVEYIIYRFKLILADIKDGSKESAISKFEEFIKQLENRQIRFVRKRIVAISKL